MLISQKNIALLSMVGAYALLLFFPHTIGNVHIRVIISLLIIFILPGFLLYSLGFSDQNHDLYHRLNFFFLLSCFFYIPTISAAYFFRLPLLFFMRSLLFLFLVAAFILLRRNDNTVVKENCISKYSIADYFTLSIIAILAYVFTCNGPVIDKSDAIPHLSVVIRITESGIIAPYHPFLKGVGPMAGYFYSPFHVIIALIMKLSASSQFIAWHHLPKIILFYTPICYYTLIKTAFKNRKLAYFALFFILGLCFSDYYWYVIQHPLPRRFLREILIPIYYILLIHYFRQQEKKRLILLIIASIVLTMFHSMGLPFIFFNGLLCLLLLSVFKNRKESLRMIIFTFMPMILVNLPYVIALFINSPISKMIKNMPCIMNRWGVSHISHGIIIFKPLEFFSTDSLFGYLVILFLIISQNNSALTLIMFAALLFVPVFTLLPPFPNIFSKIFTFGPIARLTDIHIRPFYSISIIILISYYGLKYLRLWRKKQNSYNIYWIGVLSIIAINTYLINKYFWVAQVWVGHDLLVSKSLLNIKSKIFVVLMLLITSFLFLVVNRKRTFNTSEPIVFNSKNKSHLMVVLFVPLIINLSIKFPEIISKLHMVPIVKYTNMGGYTLDENYFPKLFEYIIENNKPNSVTILVNEEDLDDYYDKNFELPCFVPQYIFHIWQNAYIHHSDLLKRKKITRKIYNNKVSVDETIKLLYQNDIDYIVAYGEENKKLSKMKNTLLLVSQDKDICLYKVLPPREVKLYNIEDCSV